MGLSVKSRAMCVSPTWARAFHFAPASLTGASQSRLSNGSAMPIRRVTVHQSVCTRFFQALYASLRHGARAIFQLYPETPDQMELIMYQATRAGFAGGVVVDYPNSTKAKKYYLCLFAGVSPDQSQMPAALATDGSTVGYERERMRTNDYKNSKLGVKNRRDFVIQKKERRERQGKDVKHGNSKYMGRKRRPKF